MAAFIPSSPLRYQQKHGQRAQIQPIAISRIRPDVTSTSIHALPPVASFLRPVAGACRTAAASSTTLSIVALLLGIFVGRISKRSRRERLISSTDAEVPQSSTFRAELDQSIVTSSDFSHEGSTPVWLNFALARMWGLFQKSTKRLVSDTMQPILDETEKPDFVKAIRVKKFIPGRQAPVIQSVRRLPSRSLSEVQYAMRGLFSSTSVTEFEVDVAFGERAFSFPVTMENLDVDANLWISSSLAPYEPYCTGVKYALLDFPKITFEMTIANVIPITAVPLLRKLFFRIITQEAPKELILPNMECLDFTPTQVEAAKKLIRESVIRDSMSEEELKGKFPEQWSLFEALDIDGNKLLTVDEIRAGLIDWGYTSADPNQAFDQLDVNSDGKVSFLEFVKNWPSLEASFVPSVYSGELIGLLRQAKGLKMGPFGGDPVAILRLNGQEVVSKRDSQTSVVGDRGNPVWMQTFDFRCSDPSTEELEVVVQSGNFLSGGKEIGKTTLPLRQFLNRRNQKVKVNLEPAGTLWLDMSYAEFV